jgi:hypothetical protein
LGAHQDNVTISYELETPEREKLGKRHLFQKDFPAMRPYSKESVRIADLLVQRFPSTGLYSRQRVRSLTLMGYALTRTGERDRGMELLKQSREEIETLVSKDKFNHQFRYQLAVTAAIQARHSLHGAKRIRQASRRAADALDRTAACLARLNSFPCGEVKELNLTSRKAEPKLPPQRRSSVVINQL